MTSFVPPKKNFASGYTFYVSLAPRTADGTWQANPTLASGDVKIAIDDGAPANLATLPVVDADFTKRVKVVLSQAETNGDNLSIIFSDAAGAEWCDLTVNLQTAAQTLDDLDGIVDSILTDTAEIGAAGAGLTEAGGTGDHLTALATQTSVDDLPTNSELATALSPIALEATLTTVAGYLDTEVVAILADTNELQTDWANGGRLDLILDARASQTSVDDLPTNAELATALGTADDAVLAAVATVDSNVDAIKAKTDSLTFTVAGQVDANIESVNGTTVTGSGTEGDPWGP